ncbi:MAG: DMT family transporter [Methylocystaceae bacterium]|nr:DMT family transporter [Methylocystaceae bacterium]
MNRSLTLKSFFTLIVLAFMWGSSFTVIKIALGTIAPLSIAAARISLAALVLLLIALWRRETFPRDISVWAWLLALAVLGNAAPFFLISWGEESLDGGMTSVLMSLVPLTVPIMAHFFTDDEKLTPYMVAGVLIGFGGLLVLVGPSVLLGLGDDLLGQGAIVLAALSYGGASMVARRLRHLPFMVVASGSMCLGAALMMPASLVIDQPWTFSPELTHWMSLIYLGLFPTALANILLLKVINSSGVSFLALNNYLVPVFGVGIAALVLGEGIPSEMISAMVIIFIGIFVSNMKRKSG